MAVGTAGQGLQRMQHSVGFDGLDRVGKRQAAMKAEPSAGVAMPLEIEAVRARSCGSR